MRASLDTHQPFGRFVTNGSFMTRKTLRSPGII